MTRFFSHFRFLGSDNHDSYFTTTQRSRIVWAILTTAAYGKRKHAEIGVERLLEEEVYVAAFPLHDVSCFNSVKFLNVQKLDSFA